MKTREIAPGSILQRMFLKRQIRKWGIKNGNFIEMGAGNGLLSRLLLSCGYTGLGFDLNESACLKNELLNQDFITKGAYQVLNKDFFAEKITHSYDLILTSMVIEHLEEKEVHTFFEKAKSALKPEGRIVNLVPASMKYWGIEDEIAGHYKRYTFACFEKLATQHGLKIILNQGLTFPLSNLLFRLSNRVVSRSESYKQNLDKKQQTILSGNREVRFKTEFPAFFRFILNEITLFPFYLLQRIFKNHPDSMVIYCEMKNR